MKEDLASTQPRNIALDDYVLKKTFLDHLNYIYYGKQHLIDFFIEVKAMATLNVLKAAIQEANDDAKNQMQHLKKMYATIAESPAKTNTLGIKAMTLEAYLSAIKASKTPLEKDIYILFYLQQIEGIEITYFKVLKNLAKSIGYSSSALDEPFDLAVENKILFDAIYREYIN